MMNLARRAILSLGCACFVASLFGAAPAFAVPNEGDTPPNARIEDAEGKGLELKTLKGKPFVIVYDDRTSAPKSAGFRRKLLELIKGAPYESKIPVLIVADVSPYDFWPARGAVKDAVREESRKQGTTVYCDWTGKLRSAYRFKNEVTNVVLVGRDGRVVFAFEGVPVGATQKRLWQALGKQISGS